MRPQDVQKAKKSVMKVMGVHTGMHWTQPYIAFKYDLAILSSMRRNLIKSFVSMTKASSTRE